MTNLHEAIENGDFQTVRSLVEIHNISVNTTTSFFGWGDTPLVIAAQFNQRKIMDYLIQKGADINVKGYGDSWWWGTTPIETALKYKHTEIVVNLLIKNAVLSTALHQTDIANEYLLKAANENDAWSIEQILTHTEAEVNTHDSFKRTPLHLAVSNENFEATFKLIEKGAKVNAIDIHHWTPLHYATSNSDAQFAQLLIEKGAKVNAMDDTERTPLFWAAQSGEEELVHLLVKHGAKINATDKHGISTLDIAIINDDSDMIKCLVFNGAKIGANINNTTPLEMAAGKGKLQAVEALIQAGSSLNHQNSEGKTALELAFKAGEMGVVNTLKLYGADVPSYIQEKLDATTTLHTDQVFPGEPLSSSYFTAPVNPNPTGSTNIEDVYHQAHHHVAAIYPEGMGPNLAMNEAPMFGN